MGPNLAAKSQDPNRRISTALIDGHVVSIIISPSMPVANSWNLMDPWPRG